MIVVGSRGRRVERRVEESDVSIEESEVTVNSIIVNGGKSSDEITRGKCTCRDGHGKRNGMNGWGRRERERQYIHSSVGKEGGCIGGLHTKRVRTKEGDEEEEEELE